MHYDLALEEDGFYRGHVKAALTVYWHDGSWRTWENRLCEFESKIVLRAVTPNRIEGRVHDYQVPRSDAPEREEQTCIDYEPLRWIDFVWVRVE